MINELYNSMKKTVSVRISSRDKNTLNDSTLKVIDLNIPISSVIYLGFVESFANVFFLITSKEIKIYSISKPYVIFEGVLTQPSTDTNPSSGMTPVYTLSHYCLYLGDRIGAGDIELFRDYQNSSLIINEAFDNQFYFDLYDPLSYFYLDDVFLGPDMKLNISTVSLDLNYYSKLDDLYKKADNNQTINLDVIPPLSLSDYSEINNHTTMMEVATFSTGYYKYKVHAIFVNHDTLEYQSYEIDLLGDVKIDDLAKIETFRNVEFVSIFVYRNMTYKCNSYLYALSVVDQKPVYHVFIISDVVSWIKQIPLTDIIDKGLKVQNSKDSTNYITNQGILIVQATKWKFGIIEEDSFFFYRVKNDHITLFDTVYAKETKDFMNKFVYVENSLYYIIYSLTSYIDIYTLNSYQNKHYIEYTINPPDNAVYITGHCCGKYLVLETGHNDFHLYKIDDILFPKKIMTLPWTEGYKSLINNDQSFYHCVGKHKIVIPMSKTNPVNSTLIDVYLFYYDLSKPLHTSLIQKLKI